MSRQEERDQALRAAVLSDDAVALAAAIAAGADPMTQDSDGEAPLFFEAVEKAGAGVIEALLKAGVPVDLPDEIIGWSPLICAITAENLPAIRFLLGAGADPNFRFDRAGATDQDVPGDWPTALSACFDPNLGDVEHAAPIVAALLGAGADPDLPDSRGWTPLMLAAHRGDLESARLLLEAGADPQLVLDESQRTAISVAEYWGRGDMIALLEASGANRSEGEILAAVEAIWEEIGAWFDEHAAPYAAALREARGADEEAIRRLEARLGGRRLPPDVRAALQLHGASGGVAYWEYTGLSVEEIASRWEGLERLRGEGTFDGWEPRELDSSLQLVQPQWWSPDWIPLAKDGGGNLLCVDLGPDVRGTRGQVIWWEIHGGPVASPSPSLRSWLESYRAQLQRRHPRYDEASGTFDRW